MQHRKLCFLLNILLFSNYIQLNAQKNSKIGVKKYWISANTSIQIGTSTPTIAPAYNGSVGVNVKGNWLVGTGVGVIHFGENIKATSIFAYCEKSTNSQKRKLFSYIKPGFAFANNAKEQLLMISRFEFNKSKLGFFCEQGAGIRWMVNKHSYFLSTGFCHTAYSIYAKEYPVVLDPYNPFVENPVTHTYKYVFNRLSINMGFTF